MSMGSRIKEQRNKLGITQPVLAEKLVLSLDMVKQLETDRKKPSIETLTKMSDLFGCSTDYLLGKGYFYSVPEVADIIAKIADKFGIDISDPEKREVLRELIIKLSEEGVSINIDKDEK